MENEAFISIPLEYKSMKDGIQNKIISDMYSRLTYLYFSTNLMEKSNLYNDEEVLKSPLFHFFESNKLITYQFFDQSEKLNYSMQFEQFSYDELDLESFPQYIKAVICVEDSCLIIESILKQIMLKIIKETKSIMINVNNYNRNKDLISEIQKFYDEAKCIKEKNDFLNLTFKSISAFFIRRYFYPSIYFKNTSFFTFDQKYRKFELESKKGISNLLLSNNQEQFDDDFATFFSKKFFNAFMKSCFEDDDQISIQKFSKSDFIFLRKIHTNETYNFYLVIHIESLYIFMIKELKGENRKGFNNEKYFCEHIRHHCINRFYGFYYEENDDIKGFVYEFMSNGSLQNYILNDENQFNDLFKFMTICRIIQGLNHLHSNSIIHRDLKPSNIFLDHDFIPYISDFDLTRYLYKEGDFTNDYGSTLYTSPEQEIGEIKSPSTDIYSFGLIIYFLFEKKHLFNDVNDIQKAKQFDIMVKLNAPKKLQEIFHGCLKYESEKRMTSNEILKIIYDEVYSFEYLEYFLFKTFDPFYNQELVNYFYENFYFVYRFDKNIVQLNYCISYTCQYVALKLIKEKEGLLDFLFHLACTYMKNQIIKHDYNKAIEYLKIAASKKHSNSIMYLELLGINDFSSTANKSKFVDYLISAAKRKNSDALVQLGNLYLDGDYVPKNVEKVIQCYKEAVELGNNKACLLLGNLYLNFMNYKIDYEKAIYYLNMAAQQGNSDALLNLGDIYYEGKGVAINYEKAFHYYNSSAIQNNPFALSKIGNLYAKGQGVKQDNSMAIKYYDQSLKVDYLGQYRNINMPQQQMFYIKEKVDKLYSKFKADTLFELGSIYININDSNFNIRKAKECFELSAQLNNDKAQCILGDIYLKGIFGEVNYQKAKYYYELSSQKNNSLAIFQLGNMYFYKLGINDKDYDKKAFYYYDFASKLGNSDATILLGYFYLDGIIVEQKSDIAFNYFKLAEKQENPSAYAALAYIYLNGNIVKDLRKAHYYYDKLACLKNSNGFLGLGHIYYNGLGVEKDVKKAIQYYELSARMGNSEAQLFLGSFYLSNNIDYSKAISYLLYSAKNKNPNAFYQLGRICTYGIGCEVNYKFAIEYYEKAAKLNHLESIYTLAKMYQEGIGTNIDISRAIYLYKKCSEIKDNRVQKYFLNDKSLITSIRSSIYDYISMNELGLIYITEPNFENKKLGVDLIKESGSNGFLFAKNNYGLILKYFIKNEDKARVIFNEISKETFCLSDFNIGHILEEKGQIDESIKYYIKASDNEDVPLIFRNQIIFDERLIISIIFIICLANLKLVIHFLNSSKYGEARNFFIKSLAKIILYTKDTSHHFMFYNKNNGVNVFSFLRKFIIECPLFNLQNQPNLNFEEYIEKGEQIVDHFDSSKLKNQNENEIFNKILKDENLHKKLYSSNDDELIVQGEIIDDPGELFDFIIRNYIYSGQFSSKISEIVGIMDEILEKPPYLILFGRIYINHQNQTEKLKQKQKLNKSFYDGFNLFN